MSRIQATNLFRLLKSRRSATRVLAHVVVTLSILGFWTLLTPIDKTVSFRTRLVPQGELNGPAGEFEPNSAAGGVIATVSAVESEFVHRGDLLLQFDSQELRIRRNGEVAKIKNLQREEEAKQAQLVLASNSHDSKIAELSAQLDVERVQDSKRKRERQIKILRARAELLRAENELKPAEALARGNAISNSEFSTVKSEHQKAVSDLAIAELPLDRSKISEIEAQIQTINAEHQEHLHRIRSEELSLQSKISTLKNEVKLLDLKIQQCNIVSPRDGVVSRCEVEVGDWMPPGPIAITVSRDGYMAEALLPSRLIGEVQKGNSAVIVLDGFDWLVHGVIDCKVMEISSDLTQEEIPLGDGSSEQVDGYRVWLELDRNSEFNGWNRLRLGMTGTLEIKTGKEKLAFHLLQRAFGESWF